MNACAHVCVCARALTRREQGSEIEDVFRRPGWREREEGRRREEKDAGSNGRGGVGVDDNLDAFHVTHDVDVGGGSEARVARGAGAMLRYVFWVYL